MLLLKIGQNALKTLLHSADEVKKQSKTDRLPE